MRRLILVVALVLMILGGADYLHRWRDQVQVMVAAVPVSAHTPLTPAVLTARRMNREAQELALPHAVHRIEDAAGLVARTDIPAGEVIRREPWLVDVAPAGGDVARARYFIPDGMRLVGVRVDSPGAVSRKVGPGDRVDVVFTSLDNGTGGVYAATILQGVEVFSVEPAGKGTSAEGSVEGLDVTLLVTPAGAQALNLAKGAGGRVDLSLNPLSPQVVRLPPTSPLEFTGLAREKGGKS